jgi:apolipoprotein N-acyltransferase
MDHELAVNEERRRRLRNLHALTAIALWGIGCYLLHFAWSITQALPSPLNDALSTAVYLITFFYIFAFWPIQSLVEWLFKGR